MILGPRTSSRPGSFGATGSNVSGSTIFTAIPGKGWPMLPRFAPTCRKEAARKSVVFTVTAGEHSVQP